MHPSLLPSPLRRNPPKLWVDFRTLPSLCLPQCLVLASKQNLSPWEDTTFQSLKSSNLIPLHFLLLPGCAVFYICCPPTREYCLYSAEPTPCCHATEQVMKLEDDKARRWKVLFSTLIPGYHRLVDACRLSQTSSRLSQTCKKNETKNLKMVPLITV